MSTTLSTAQEMLAEYILAERAVLKNQAYTIRDRTYKRADLVEIRAGRAEWERKCKQILHGGMRVRRVIPRSN